MLDYDAEMLLGLFILVSIGVVKYLTGWVGGSRSDSKLEKSDIKKADCGKSLV